MLLHFMHVLCASIWFGSAFTFPFWGKRLKSVDNVDMALGISDTVFFIKVSLVMGGLTGTIFSGVALMRELSLPLVSPTSGELNWLGVSAIFCVVIAINSCLIFYLMWKGRLGKRSHYRYVPCVGYNNLGLISIVIGQMTLKPTGGFGASSIAYPLIAILAANSVFWFFELRKRHRLATMSAQEYATSYFSYLRDENMYEVLRLLEDSVCMTDPMSHNEIKGIVEIEQFFQFLNDQFETLTITPDEIECTPISARTQMIRTSWTASGMTRNGSSVQQLKGTNTMIRNLRKISRMDIDFALEDLPRVNRFRSSRVPRDLDALA